MATKEEQQQLINTLKFTPRTYKISMWGYGGEKVMGTVDPKVWDYCMEHSVDLVDIAWGDEDTAQEEMGLDLDQLPFTPGQWYETDNMAHVNGVSRNSGSLQIEDENGETVLEKQLEDLEEGEDGPVWSCTDEVYIGLRKKGEVVFVGSSNEKGTFFEGEFELRAPFDITKLELYYEEIDGEEIVNSIYYDGEEIDNNGGSTDGKSSDMIMVRLTDDEGNFERYEPEEKDWGHPEYGTSPSDWESSSKFKFEKQKPTIPGYYSCNYGYGSTYGSLYWDGSAFGDWEYGKFHAKDDDSIVSWQGYNWDTSSWVNQPPEPPGLICDNKSCGWVGSSDDRREDEEYNSHCPACDGTEFTWIDYDPDTKQGRANRAKYCKPWDPEVSMNRIVKAFPVTEEETAFELDKIDVPVLEGEEMWAQEVIDESMLNPWFPGDIKPKYKGTYEVEYKIATWPWPSMSHVEWTGRKWKFDREVNTEIKQWRGLNQPPEEQKIAPFPGAK